MAKVTRSKSKATASAKAKPKAASKTKSESTRRTAADIDALVPEFVSMLQDGAKMQEVKAKFGFTNGQPIRAALRRAGFDSKGQKAELEPIKMTGNAKSIAQRIMARREKGESWDSLIAACDAEITLPEIKKLCIDGGYKKSQVEGRAYPEAKPKPKAKAKGKKSSAASE